MHSQTVLARFDFQYHFNLFLLPSLPEEIPLQSTLPLITQITCKLLWIIACFRKVNHKETMLSESSLKLLLLIQVFTTYFPNSIRNAAAVLYSKCVFEPPFFLGKWTFCILHVSCYYINLDKLVLLNSCTYCMIFGGYEKSSLWSKSNVKSSFVPANWSRRKLHKHDRTSHVALLLCSKSKLPFFIPCMLLILIVTWPLLSRSGNPALFQIVSSSGRCLESMSVSGRRSHVWTALS